jgi:hypothetical protein
MKPILDCEVHMTTKMRKLEMQLAMQKGRGCDSVMCASLEVLGSRGFFVLRGTRSGLGSQSVQDKELFQWNLIPV